MNKENKSRNKRSEKNYAAIDIGSNAVRLLIKHINENSEKKFSKVLSQTIEPAQLLQCGMLSTGKILLK